MYKVLICKGNILMCICFTRTELGVQKLQKIARRMGAECLVTLINEEVICQQ